MTSKYATKHVSDLAGKWDLVGEVAVDSGTMIVIDPCYVDNHDSHGQTTPAKTRDELVGPYSSPDEWKPKSLVLESTGPGATFVRLSNFGGDGSFPVYVKYVAGEVAYALVAFQEFHNEHQ